MDGTGATKHARFPSSFEECVQHVSDCAGTHNRLYQTVVNQFGQDEIEIKETTRLEDEAGERQKHTPPPRPSDAPSQIRTRPRRVKFAVREILCPYVHFGTMTVGVYVQRDVI